MIYYDDTIFLYNFISANFLYVLPWLLCVVKFYAIKGVCFVEDLKLFETFLYFQLNTVLLKSC